jgi:GTP-binding protein EngB required for normal cell division
MKEADYNSYIKAFTRLFEVYDAATPYLEVPEDFKHFINRKRAWLERLKSPEFPVAFLGAFSAGKSTIINAVLGDDILPQATKSLTAIPTLIRKGRSNKAIISYLSASERAELKDLYLEELSKELRTNPEAYRALSNSDILARLNADIERQKSQYGTFNKQKFYDELKTLIQGWDRLVGATKEITLDELPNYVTEDYADVLFVNQAEVYLTDVNIPENVVLVDLPGLGVVNPRHRKVTKTYVENDAKAFVIAMKVFHLLEGEEIELLSEIHSQRKRVLQRAFWVINQWDVLSSKQKKEELANFDQKIEHYGFHITKDRVFKVSALNYLLLKLIQEGRLEASRSIREHVDALKKAVGRIPDKNEASHHIKALEETKSFSTFRASLFEYLAYTAKAEFLEEARSEFLDLAKRLKEWLDPLYLNYKDVDDEGMKSTFIASQLSNRQDEALRRIKATVENHIKMLRTELLPEFVFWRDEDQTQLSQQVSAAIDTMDRKALKNELLKGLDLNSVVSRLPHKIEENLNIQHAFRSQLQRLLEEHMIKRHLAHLLKAITDTDVLPDEVVQVLNDRLNGRDMVNRLKGMCDVFLFEYGDVINQFGRTVMEQEALHETQSTENILKAVQGNVDDALKVARSMNLIGPKDSIQQMKALGYDALSRIHTTLLGAPPAANTPVAQTDAIDRALDYYKAGILDYARKQQHQINIFARRGIKNYFEELEVELLAYFDSIRGEIAKMIMRQLTEDLDAELDAELEKQKIIKDTYSFMMNEVNALAG